MQHAGHSCPACNGACVTSNASTFGMGAPPAIPCRRERHFGAMLHKLLARHPQTQPMTLRALPSTTCGFRQPHFMTRCDGPSRAARALCAARSHCGRGAAARYPCRKASDQYQPSLAGYSHQRVQFLGNGLDERSPDILPDFRLPVKTLPCRLADMQPAEMARGFASPLCARLPDSCASAASVSHKINMPAPPSAARKSRRVNSPVMTASACSWHARPPCALPPRFAGRCRSGRCCPASRGRFRRRSDSLSGQAGKHRS